ncbi:cytochrome c oxidase accessory protein CcoG [Candidatus Halobeggiatoa sp. HSG11]|nr:cytochrome c oxidase accessory protein CcoG [Candidatus Halobeggiatoa sp. HSG11]
MNPSNFQSNELYAKHEKIYPRIAYGFFSRLKILSGLILLGIYYIFPWLQWGERQAVLFDLPARQFHIFGITFWPQDFIYLAFILILAAITLFFFTTLAGRLWCGFACPQTIWTDAFLWMERLVEGDRPKQMKLAQAPMSLRKFRIIVTKQTLWLVFSLFTGFTFVGYFTPIHELTQAVLIFNLSGWETFWMLFYGFAVYSNAGFLREQVCMYMCPYARFQSAMFDKNTMIIAYDEKRGESRGPRKRNVDHKKQGLGDCINCTMCVQVCPTGIDIRDGMQYQCISCSACIDACDKIMDKMDYPKGLISYTTENNLNGIPTKVWRPRIFFYACILIAIFVGIGISISNRSMAEIDVIRDRTSLFKEVGINSIENVYQLRIMNLDDKPHNYDITVDGIEGLKLIKDQDIQVNKGSVITVPVRLLAHSNNLHKRSTKITFHLTVQGDQESVIVEEARFLGPIIRGVK